MSPTARIVPTLTPATLTSSPGASWVVEIATAAELHVHQERGARGHHRGGGRLRPERHDLTIPGQVGDGAGLGHVHRVAPDRQPGRDDVAERNQHADFAIECDPQHAVEVPIGHQEPAAEGLQPPNEIRWRDITKAAPKMTKKFMASENKRRAGGGVPPRGLP